MMTDAGFLLLTITNIVASIIIFAGALSERMRLFPTWHKVGLIIAALGLVFQAGRNVQFLVTGISPSDADLPVWALKDIGISVVAFFYAYIAYEGWKKAKEPIKTPTKTPTKRKPRK
jgi:ABC-type thiamin/hydroxymethylpyrimidine transport system permease subunit